MLDSIRFPREPNLLARQWESVTEMAIRFAQILEGQEQHANLYAAGSHQQPFMIAGERSGDARVGTVELQNTYASGRCEIHSGLEAVKLSPYHIACDLTHTASARAVLQGAHRTDCTEGMSLARDDDECRYF